MQIVSSGVSLHEMSCPVFEEIFPHQSSAENFTWHAGNFACFFVIHGFFFFLN